MSSPNHPNQPHHGVSPESIAEAPRVRRITRLAANLSPSSRQEIIAFLESINETERAHRIHRNNLVRAWARDHRNRHQPPREAPAAPPHLDTDTSSSDSSAPINANILGNNNPDPAVENRVVIVQPPAPPGHLALPAPNPPDAPVPPAVDPPPPAPVAVAAAVDPHPPAPVAIAAMDIEINPADPQDDNADTFPEAPVPPIPRNRAEHITSTTGFQTLLDNINATDAIIPNVHHYRFVNNPTATAYYAIHMIGIAAPSIAAFRRAIGFDSEHLPIDQVLALTTQRYNQFRYVPLHPNDLTSTRIAGAVYGTLPRTRPIDLPVTQANANTFLLTVLRYGRVANDGTFLGQSQGFTIHRAALLISGHDHTWYVSDKWIRQANTIADTSAPTITRRKALDHFRQRLAVYTYPDPKSNRSRAVRIMTSYYIYRAEP